MAIFKRQPKKKSGESRYTRLYQVDDDYIISRINDKQFESFGEALCYYVNVGLRVEKQKEIGKDETMYAVVKKQEMVVLEGTRPLVESIETFGRTIEDLQSTQEQQTNDLLKRLERLEEHAVRQRTATSRLLEVTIICYGILRHYVLGLFVVRLTKTPFQSYANGFIKRLELIKLSIRSGNLLLEGEYENLAEEFARGLADATGVQIPQSNDEQSTAQ
jgi:hypothetical protein